MLFEKSWIIVPENSDFPLQNIPFGVFKTIDSPARLATIIGDTIIDLNEIYKAGLLKDTGTTSVFETNYLNSFISQGKKII